MVILKRTNPKTKETAILPTIKIPSSHKHLAIQATAVEARHFAATYALFRVCNMLKIHMMLPPTYKDLWKGDFQQLKNSDFKDGKAWMYEADPFAAVKEREEAQSLMAKKREEKEKLKAKEGEKVPNIGSSGAGEGIRNNMRGWTRIPKVEMGKRTRLEVEELVRQNVIWNPHNIKLSEFQRRNIVNELISLEFRRSHIEEAVAECKDREETLEWLLVHVPEDDLPKWSLPEGYTAGISLASGNLKRDASIKRLAEAGYSSDICEKLLSKYDGDEDQAAEALQKSLVQKGDVVEDHTANKADSSFGFDQENKSIWVEEMGTLEAIFDSRFERSTSEQCIIGLQISSSKAPYRLSVRRSSSYPMSAPIMVVTSPELPAYIRLSVICHAVEHASANLLGEPMIFNLVDWLEASIPAIVDEPGKLRAVSTGASFLPRSSKSNIKSQTSASQRSTRKLDWQDGSRLSLAMLSHWRSRQSDPRQIKMLSQRQSLPAWKLQDDIVSAVNSHQVTIISGETGSGKSTQSVQFILDDMIQRQLGVAANIICTQPRRISVLGLADRVSDERCSSVGSEVGYAIRGEARQTPGVTKVSFVTTGVLLRRLQTSGGARDDVVAALSDVSHVFVDEVHERSLDTDFLLVLLRDVLSKRKDLKVILMSATLDAAVFEKYFRCTSSVGKVEIQGRTFPVDDYYLDDVIRITGFTIGGESRPVEKASTDVAYVTETIQTIGMQINYDLIANLVEALDSELGATEGGILIFLPGTAEINRTLDAVRRIPNIHALPLHASLLPDEQRRVFAQAPKGRRKVIAATNVAETSITIEDIVAVIDTGKVKETSFDPQNNMVKLEEKWASRAACKQRRGRAGRVQAGKCYKLYTRNAEAKMAERPEPEIRRVPLEQLCLSVRAMGISDVAAFVASSLTPPESLAVEGAMELLSRIGALDGSELTALGRHLAMIPADLRCAKLMVYGATYGCLEACLIIAAILTVKSPFVSPQNKRGESKAAKSSFARDQGDLIGDLRAYEDWSALKKTSHQRAIRMWCDEHYLSYNTLNDISSNRLQYLSSLKEVGFLPLNYDSSTDISLNAQTRNDALIRALISGAFNPQLARIDFPDKKYTTSMSGAVELDPEAKTIKYFNQDNGRVFVHPSSTLFDAQGFSSGAVYMSYFNKMATSKVFIRDLTPFNAYTLLLFSGPISLDTMGRGLVVDGWLRLRGWARIGVLVSRLRIMLDEVLAKKIESPALDLSSNEVVKIARKLVELDGLDR